MNKRWYILAAILVFSVTLGVVVGLKLATLQAQALALGVAVGAATGTGLALFLLRDRLSAADDVPPDHVSIIMPRAQAETLIKMLNTRKQADPDAYPITAEQERRFVAVGGASLEEDEFPTS